MIALVLSMMKEGRFWLRIFLLSTVVFLFVSLIQTRNELTMANATIAELQAQRDTLTQQLTNTHESMQALMTKNSELLNTYSTLRQELKRVSGNEKVKKWSDTSVPDDIKRLFNKGTTVSPQPMPLN